MAQSGEPVDTTMPTTVEVDRRRLAALEAARAELGATQKVLAVITERLLAVVGGGDSVVISDEQFQQSPDLRAVRDAANKEVVVTVFR